MAKFARASIRDLEKTAAILWPEEVNFYSQDDKAKVSIEITLAKKQIPLLMHMEYQVTLPDHDCVAGSKHKIIPFILGVMKVFKS